MPQRVWKKVIWKLDCLSKKKLEKFKVGKTIESSKFSIDLGNIKTKWSLHVYPSGCEEKFKDHISFVADLITSSSLEFKVFLDFGIISTRNDKSHLSFFARAASAEHCLSGYGKFDFLSHEKLLDPENEFSVGGKLTLFCNITLVKSEGPIAIGPLENIHMDPGMTEMFEKQLFTDFQILASDGKIVKAHKAKLASRSPEFFELLMGHEADKVEITDVNSEVLKLLLHFIYSNEVDGFDAVTSDFVDAAKKYKIRGLGKAVVDHFLDELHLRHDVLPTLQIADKLTEAEALMERCLDLIAMNFEMISCSKDWVNVPQDVVTKAALILASSVNPIINI